MSDVPRIGRLLGHKADDGKRRYSLLPWVEIGVIVDVFEYGAEKYQVGNWAHVPHGRDRYLDAAMRHITARFNGERVDLESGLPHLAHAAASLIMAMWHERGE